MKITKLGHCCLYVEVNGVHILTDPGVFSDAQNSVSPVDIILITHEHADHLHVDSVAAVLCNNPQAVIYTNQAVATLLNVAGIAAIILEGSDQLTVKGITLKAFDSQHEEIYEALGQVQNTGYLIAGRLFYPGDSFHEPQCPIEVLALPVAGPWCTVGAAIRYALRVEPKAAFPVHDGMIEVGRIGSFHTAPKAVLESAGITFIALKAGESAVF
jgi:L-ascorbate metabolism protein UlaG (beta-lactamase superfamily)